MNTHPDHDAAPAASPFHADELAVQARTGRMGSGTGIRRFMPDQHRSFFEGLPYAFLATTDADGWPLATMLTGAPGFIRSPDDTTLRLAALPHPQDPSASTLVPGQEVGLLGLDLSNRRRNRANGSVARRDADGWTLAVRQSFGNCAKYIQRRTAEPVAPAAGPIEQLGGLDADARGLISDADTLFVASRSRAAITAAGGLDVSHRGGRPGFVAIDGDTLSIPDYPGNRFFNTFGNLSGEPRASLLFIDFTAGDLVQLQGIAALDWDGARAREVPGAERAWRFTVVRGWRQRAACPLRWEFGDYSPATLAMGVRLSTAPSADPRESAAPE